MKDWLRSFFKREAGVAWRMFWLGLVVRLLYVTLAHTYRMRVYDDHFEFGWEAGRIARALATGFGFADPFNGHTGPSAWTPADLSAAACGRVQGVRGVLRWRRDG